MDNSERIKLVKHSQKEIKNPKKTEIIKLFNNTPKKIISKNNNDIFLILSILLLFTFLIIIFYYLNKPLNKEVTFRLKKKEI